MALLEKLCQEIGMESGEEWIGVGVHTNPPKYTIADNTLWIYHKYKSQDDSKWEWKEASMADYVALIKGELRPRWVPEWGEGYYYPRVDLKRGWEGFHWADTTNDNHRLNNNLVFKTKEEAVECANKMLEAIKEDN